MKKLLPVLMVILFATVIHAEEKEKLNIAVVDFKAQPPVSPSEAAFVTEFFRGELVMADVFNVIEKENMDKILAEQGFQQTGCTTSECAVKMGKILNTRQMINGKFGKLENKYILTVSIIDVETAKIVYSDRQTSASIEKINDDIAKLADRVIDNVGGKGLARKTTKERLLRKHRVIPRSITHRKNKISLKINPYGDGYSYYYTEVKLARRYGIGAYWSPFNYLRFGLNTTRTNTSNGYSRFEESGDYRNYFRGTMETLYFDVSLDMPCIAEMSNTMLGLVLGKKNYEPSVGVPVLWRIVPFLSYGIGTIRMNGGIYNRDTDNNFELLSDTNRIHLFTQVNAGCKIIINEHISLLIAYDLENYMLSSLSDIANIMDLIDVLYDYDMHTYYLGIEYTF